MNRFYCTLLLLLPLLSSAEGQYGLGIFLDTIDFIIVSSIWLISVFILIQLINWLRTNKLSKTKKRTIWIITGLIALFTWSMIKHDSHPYEGPIDSIFKSVPEYAPYQPQPDGTIETTIQSVDSTELGVYKWIDGKKIFIRELNENEKQ